MAAVVCGVAAVPGVAMAGTGAGVGAGVAAGVAAGGLCGRAQTLADIWGDLWSWMTLRWVAGHKPEVVAGLAVASVLALWIAGTLRRGSLDKRRDLSEQPWFIWMAAALMVFVSGQFAAGLAVSSGYAGSIESVRGQAIVGLANIGASVLAGLVMVRMIAESPARAGLAVGLTPALIGVGAFVLSGPIVWGTQMLAAWTHVRLGGTIDSPVAHSTLAAIVDHRDDPWSVVLIAVAVLGAPVVEEITYRGLVQSAFVRMTGSGWAGVVLGSALFAGLHFVGGGMPWYAIAQVFALGVCMGVAFERTRSLATPVVMHALFNGLNVAIAMGVGGG